MQITIEQFEKINPQVPVKVEDREMVFNTPTAHTLWRVQSLFQKEPDTIEWLNSFQPGEVVYDVGANVGMYTVYAAVMRDVSVFAFEPESLNFSLLNRNIFSNNLAGKVKAFPVALSDETAFDVLYLSQFNIGGSCHNFGESVDYNDKPFNSGFQQGCFSVPLDQLIEKHNFPQPDHIKIDVDGLEHKVIAGALNTIKAGVKSVLIEINTRREDHNETVKLMESLGYEWSEEQVNAYIRKDGPFEGTGNFIFYRKKDAD